MPIRDIQPHEHQALGELLAQVYAQLEGFPTPQQQPAYYDMLRRVGRFTETPGARVLVAVDDDGTLLGGVVYFGDMAHYGSGGSATAERHTSGMRLLGVAPQRRGAGVGRALTLACLDAARASGNTGFVLHTTQAMRKAWQLYEGLGFSRAEDLDFMQGELPVFGFRLPLGSGVFRVRQIDHLVLRVRDLPAMLRFYTGVLGGALERVQDHLGLYQVRFGTSLIDLVTLDGPLGRQGGAAPGAQGRNLDHFCLRVETFEPEAMASWLRTHGVEPGPVKPRYGADGEGPSLYLNDPEGNTVELKGPPLP